jgi:hypothetical protein
MPARLNLKLIQGSSFTQEIRWESNTKVYRAIASIQKSAPVEISTIEAHGIPERWRVKISNVQGMKEINSDEYVVVSNVLPGSFQLNSINAIGYTMYTSGGVVEYNAPVGLAGYSARMQIRPSVSSEVVLLELTSADNEIVVNDEDKVIAITISAAESMELDFKTAVYSLEMIGPAGNVVTLVNGTVSLVKEVTR